VNLPGLQRFASSNKFVAGHDDRDPWLARAAELSGAAGSGDSQLWGAHFFARWKRQLTCLEVFASATDVVTERDWRAKHDARSRVT